MKRTIVALLLLSFIGCEAKKSSNPLSPSVAGPIPGVEITAPKLLEPAQGFKFKEAQQPIDLLIENASTNGVRPLSYTFEVATDTNFGTKVFARSSVPPGEGGRTKLRIDKLDLGRIYYWRARAEDGANSSTYASAQFEVLPKAQLNPPVALSPINNERVETRQPTLRVRNSDRNAAIGTVRYEFQLAVNQTFTALVASADVGEGGGETSYTVGAPLTNDLPHFWRVRASDGETTSEWMTPQTFRTPLGPAGPGPGPGPAPAPSGGPCVSANPQTIVECERAKYGHMSHGQLATFLRSVARSLNANGIGGGPFGMLVKPDGNNCSGSSCDIICSGQGGSQRQWDVLGDVEGAQTPGWSEVSRSHMTVRPCEIQ